MGQSPWRLALRRLRRDRVSLAFGVLFVALVLGALAAPIWASAVADREPNRTNETGQIEVDGKPVNVVSLDGVPIGPQWGGEYFLGADANGRDVMVRLLYGARNSLLIGLAAALLTTILATVVGLVAGYFGRWVDAVARSTLDVIWAFPVILLGVALGTALAILFIGFYSRVLRSSVLDTMSEDFVRTARAKGLGERQVLLRHVLRNSLIPIVTLWGLDFGAVVAGGAILTETVFDLQGVGQYAAESVGQLDVPPVLAVTLFGAFFIVVLNTVVDIVYALLDPRIRVTT